MEPVMKGGIMPIKDPTKRREYQRELMRKKRQGLTVSPGLDPVSPVRPSVSPINKMLDLAVRPVRPSSEMLDHVSPIEKVSPEAVSLDPAQAVSPCPLNHHSLTDLFHQATTKIKQDYQLIYQDPEASRKCFNCHNLARNYQILLNLLEKY